MLAVYPASRTASPCVLPLFHLDPAHGVAGPVDSQQAEFHRRYEAYPEDVKFELIGGIVYMASPLRWPHARYTNKLGMAFGLYEASTPGVEAGDDATAIRGDESEPQPDLALRILRSTAASRD